MRGFINGIIFTLALLIGGAVAGVFGGVLPAGADNPPPALEEWAAQKSLHATMNRETVGLANPVSVSDENFLAAIKSYGENCAVCHGASDGKASTLAKGFYIKSPQLATDGVEDDPEAITFWKLKHGIRFTAMPAFGGNLSDDDLWKLALFLKHMDKLPPAADTAWKAIPSVGS